MTLTPSKSGFTPGQDANRTLASSDLSRVLQRLSGDAHSDLSVASDAIRLTSDGVFGLAQPPRPSHLRFVVDEVPLQLSVGRDGDQTISQIWAELGHVPYTAQAPERRRMLLAILRSIKGLDRVQFLVQGGQRILIFSEWRHDEHPAPDDIIYQTVMMMQQARPFLRLLAPYL